MNLDLDEIRKPLGAFAKQSESQRYIKNIRNLGDAWRRLSDKPVADCDKDSIVIETNFGLTMKISPTGVEISINPVTESTEMKTEQGLPVSTDKMKMQEDSTPTEADTTMQEPTQEPSASTSTKKAQRPKQYRIFADFCTDFLWREPDDIADDSDDEYMIESQELLDSPSFPPSLLGLYDAWVETYNENFDRRLNKPGDFQASVFPTRSESVAWDMLRLESTIMPLDLEEIRKPLSVFAKQSESQRYIKNIRNLGDAWRRLSDQDEPLAECDRDSILIETHFGLNMEIAPAGVEIFVVPVTESTESTTEQDSTVISAQATPAHDATKEPRTFAETELATKKATVSTQAIEIQEPKQEPSMATKPNSMEGPSILTEPGVATKESDPSTQTTVIHEPAQEPPIPTEIDLAMQEPSMPTKEDTQTQKSPRFGSGERTKKYRIWADFCTDFLWHAPDDNPMESADLLESPSYPPSLLELYDAWVDTYNDSFERRLNKTGDFKASVFANTSENVAWEVAGYLLAWRMAMSPDVESIEYNAGGKEWMLQKDKGEETKLTKEFFELMCDRLKVGNVW
ncbi:unnamed protein product [Penicillium bialowiezense]